jgi:quercetin dioxygenase-like cupin family protein
MSRKQFEEMLAAEGYAAVDRTMDPSMVVPDHTHDFDAKLLITSGEISVTVAGKTQTCGPGDQFELAKGTVHSEVVGPDGVSFIAGRR